MVEIFYRKGHYRQYQIANRKSVKVIAICTIAGYRRLLTIGYDFAVRHWLLLIHRGLLITGNYSIGMRNDQPQPKCL